MSKTKCVLFGLLMGLSQVNGVELKSAEGGKVIDVEIVSYDETENEVTVRPKGRAKQTVGMEIFDEASQAIIKEKHLAFQKALEEEQGHYQKLKKLTVIDFTKNTRKLDIIKRHAGEEVLIYTERDTFDFDKGKSKDLGILSKYKGKDLWVECNLEVKWGWMRAKIHELADHTYGESHSEGLILMKIEEFISADEKFHFRMEQALEEAEEKK